MLRELDGDDYPSRIRQQQAPKPGGGFGGRSVRELSGDRIVHDPNAGLITIINPTRPSDWLLRRYDDRYRGGASLLLQDGSVSVGEERVFELAWPPGRPQYYLKRVDEDTYRRVEIADKEGYTVSVQPNGTLPELTVDLELARNRFTPGKYDETIRTFVGRPTLMKRILTSQVPVTTGEQTLVMWVPAFGHSSAGQTTGEGAVGSSDPLLERNAGVTRADGREAEGAAGPKVSTPELPAGPAGVAVLLEPWGVTAEGLDSAIAGQVGAARNIELDMKFVEAEETAARALQIDPAERFSASRWNNSSHLNNRLARAVSEDQATVLYEPHVTTQNTLTTTVRFERKIPSSLTAAGEDEDGEGKTERDDRAVHVEYSLCVTLSIMENAKVLLDLEAKTSIRPHLSGATMGMGGEPGWTVESGSSQLRLLVEDGSTVAIGGLYPSLADLDLGRFPVSGDATASRPLADRIREMADLGELLSSHRELILVLTVSAVPANQSTTPKPGG